MHTMKHDDLTLHYYITLQHTNKQFKNTRNHKFSSQYGLGGKSVQSVQLSGVLSKINGVGEVGAGPPTVMLASQRCNLNAIN